MFTVPWQPPLAEDARISPPMTRPQPAGGYAASRTPSPMADFRHVERIRQLESENRLLQMRVDDYTAKITSLQSKMMELLGASNGKNNPASLATVHWKEVDRLEAELRESRSQIERERLLRIQKEDEVKRLQAQMLEVRKRLRHSEEARAQGVRIQRTGESGLQAEVNLLRQQLAEERARGAKETGRLSVPAPINEESPAYRHLVEKVQRLEQELREARSLDVRVEPAEFKADTCTDGLFDVLRDAMTGGFERPQPQHATYRSGSGQGGGGVVAHHHPSDEMLREMKRLERKVSNLTQENKKLQQQVEKERSRSESDQLQLLEAKAAVQLAEGKVAGLESDARKAAMQLTNLETLRRKCETLEAKCLEQEGLLSSYKTDAQIYQSKVTSLSDEMGLGRKQLEVALERGRRCEALEAKLGAKEATEKEQAEKIAQLTEEKKGLKETVTRLHQELRHQCEQIEALRRAQDEMHALRGDRAEREERLRCLQAELKDCTDELVELRRLKEEVIALRQERLVKEDVVQELRCEVRQYQDEIANLQRAHAEVNEAHTRLIHSNEACRRELAAAAAGSKTAKEKSEKLELEQEKTSKLLQQLRECETAIATLKGQAEGRAEKLALTQREAQRYEEEVGRLAQELRSVREAHLAEQSKALAQLEEKDRKISQATDELQRERSAASERMEDLLRTVATLRPKVESLEHERNEAQALAAAEAKKAAESAAGLQTLESRLEQAKETLAQRSKSHEEIIRRMEAETDRDLSTLRQRVRELEMEAAHRAQEVALDRDKAIEILKKELESARTELLHLRMQLEQVTKQADSEQRSADTMRQKADALEREVTRTQRERDTLETERQRELDLWNAKITQEKDRAAEVMALMDKQIQQLVEDRDRSQEDLQECQQQLSQAREAVARLKEQVRHLTQVMGDKEAVLSGEHTGRAKAEQKVQQLQEQVSELRRQLQRRETEAKELIRAVEQQAAETASAKAKRDELEKAIREAEGESQRQQTRAELAERQRTDEVEQLRERLKDEQEQLLRVRNTVDDLEARIQEEHRQYCILMEERRNDHGMVIDPLKAKVESQQAELHRLRDRCSVYERQHQEGQERNAQLHKEVTDLRIKLAAADADRSSQERRLEEVKEELQGKSAELAAGKQSCDELAGEVARLRTQLEQCRDEASKTAGTAHAEHTALKATLQEANKELLAQREKVAELTEQVNRLDEKNAELTGLLEERSEEATSHRGRAQAYEAKVRADLQRIRELEVELDSARRDVRNLEAKVKDYDEVAHKLRETTSVEKVLRDQLTKSEHERHVSSQRVLDLEAERVQLISEARSNTDTIQRLQAEKDKLSTEYAVLSRRFEDRGGEVASLQAIQRQQKETILKYEKEAALTNTEKQAELDNEKAQAEHLQRQLLQLREVHNRVSAELEQCRKNLESAEDKERNAAAALETCRRDRDEALARAAKYHDQQLADRVKELESSHQQDVGEQRAKMTKMALLLCTVLQKIHSLISDRRGLLQPQNIESAELRNVPAVLERWKGTPDAFDTSEAQGLFCQTLTLLNRLIEALEQRARSTSTTPSLSPQGRHHIQTQ